MEKMSSGAKFGLGFGVRRYIILEYRRHMCHQANFLKGTRDFMYKDESEPV